MANYITKAQYDELAELESFGFDRKGWNKKLKEYTGIVGRPYTAYVYYDAAGNYIGDSNEDDLDSLLKEANVEVKDG